MAGGGSSVKISKADITQSKEDDIEADIEGSIEKKASANKETACNKASQLKAIIRKMAVAKP